jgi:multiple sugar transport system permease protein
MESHASYAHAFRSAKQPLCYPKESTMIGSKQQPTAQQRTVRGARRPWQDDAFWGYLFIAPQVIGLLAFVLFPVGYSLYLCFATWDFIDTPQWAGLANFRAVFADDVFWTSVRNTFSLVLGIVPLTMGCALVLALLTNRPLRGLGFYKAAFFLPMVTASVAIAMVWYWLYAPDFGLINTGLSYLGITGPGWLADPAWAKPAVIIMATWQGVGYFYLLFLAGLKNVPREFYEAAALDGANRLNQFRYITLPLLSPTTFFILTTMLISTFGIFNEVFILTRGGPVYATHTMVMYIYNQAFQFFKMGEAAVASWVLFVILFIVTLIQLRFARRWVHYVE